MENKLILIVGGVALVALAYLAYKTNSLGTAAVTILNDAGATLGSAAFDLLNPGIHGSTVGGADIASNADIAGKKRIIATLTAQGVPLITAQSAVAYWHVGDPEPTADTLLGTDSSWGGMYGAGA